MIDLRFIAFAVVGGGEEASEPAWWQDDCADSGLAAVADTGGVEGVVTV